MNLTPVDFKAVAAKGCYVYAYLREHDCTPYYIGFASTPTRPFERHNCQLPAYNALIVVLRSGLTEDQAFGWEKYFILRYGRKDTGNGLLLNQTDGGEGCLGRVCNEETRQYIRETLASELALKFGFSIREWLQMEKTMRYRMPKHKANADKFGLTVKEWLSLPKGQKISFLKNQKSVKKAQSEQATIQNMAQQQKAADRWGVPLSVYLKLDGNQSRAMKQYVRRGQGTSMDYLVAKGWAA